YVFWRKLTRGDACALKKSLRQAVAKLGELLEPGVVLLARELLCDRLVEEPQPELAARERSSATLRAREEDKEASAPQLLVREPPRTRRNILLQLRRRCGGGRSLVVTEILAAVVPDAI